MFRRSLFAVLSFALVACGPVDEMETADESTGTQEQAVCPGVTTVTFGTIDNFAGGPDPLPYAPTALPDFVTYLNGQGIPTAMLKTLDDGTSGKHTVATLRHGLRSCFAANCTLQVCFRARALVGVPQNDRVTIYNTDFGVYSFPQVASVPVVPNLQPSWNPGQVATMCMPLNMNLVGDMLQFQMQDASSVDYIQMILSC